jgi:hypothetical protein
MQFMPALISTTVILQRSNTSFRNVMTRVVFADNFVVCFDTYNDGINGYRFMVTAAGVQYDEKASPANPHDASWDAVWESACQH